MKESHKKLNNLSSGFTIIEAIVSMFILGMAILPIMAMLSQSINQLNRISESNAKSSATESALAVIGSVNPMKTPSGEIEMGNYGLIWNSEVLVPPNQDVVVGAGLAGYQVGFYNVTIELFRNNRPWFEFRTRKIGHNRIDAGNNPFMNENR